MNGSKKVSIVNLYCNNHDKCIARSFQNYIPCIENSIDQDSILSRPEYYRVNYLLVSSKFCLLLITFAKKLDPECWS